METCRAALNMSKGRGRFVVALADCIGRNQRDRISPLTCGQTADFEWTHEAEIETTRLFERRRAISSYEQS
ncbi:unnamed protein product [Lasius platythorax]|uniref:Uncharacterized protein n=1 Tax=Lasius platythorax TaxID=488582 RepID=A0AAV2P9M2_9HYME